VIDGPVDRAHPALAGARFTSLGPGTCDPPDGAACRHGTFIAGLLAAARNSAPPGICPGCSLLVRPVFTTREANFILPSAEPEELATAITEAIEAGARVINLSVALLGPDAPRIQTALDYAMRRGVLVTAASGNRGVIGSTAITRHPWVIPVVACDGSGWPLAVSNLSASAGRNGVLAPGEGIVGLTAGGGFHTASGTSVAVPFVSGALALLASLCPWADSMELRRAITTRGNPRRSLVPPLLDAAAAWRALREGRR
jgi:subtilisin family serine protease